MLLLERAEFVAEQAGSTARGWQSDLGDVVVEDTDVLHLLDPTHDGFWDSSAGRYLDVVPQVQQPVRTLPRRPAAPIPSHPVADRTRAVPGHGISESRTVTGTCVKSLDT